MFTPRKQYGTISNHINMSDKTADKAPEKEVVETSASTETEATSNTSEQSTDELLAEIARLNNQVKGLQKRQSDGDKLNNELTAKLEKTKESFDTLQNSLKEKGVDVENIKELENIEELKAEKTLLEMQYKVAEEKGLPIAMARRLRGSSEEEMAEDAESFKQYLAQPVKPASKAPVKKADNVQSQADRILEAYKAQGFGK